MPAAKALSLACARDAPEGANAAEADAIALPAAALADPAEAERDGVDPARQGLSGAHRLVRGAERSGEAAGDDLVDAAARAEEAEIDLAGQDLRPHPRGDRLGGELAGARGAVAEIDNLPGAVRREPPRRGEDRAGDIGGSGGREGR